MVLESGDRLFFDIQPAVMILQGVSRVNLTEEAKSNTDSSHGCDIVMVSGTNVGLLLYRLTTPGQEGLVVMSAPGTSYLRVEMEYDTLGRVTYVFYTDHNEIRLKAYERDLLIDAIRSRSWRLFQ